MTYFFGKYMSNPNLLDPALEEVLESVKPSDEIEIAVRLKNPDDVPAELRVISRFGDVITCRIQAGSVREVRSSPSIISVKYNRPLPLAYDPRADIETAYDELTLPNSCYNDGYRIPREFGGEGVLIAFLDWGIAYAEKAFLDENNETRFLAIWDQGADYSSEKPNKYGYGRIFLKDEINASLKTDDPYSFLGYNPARADPLGLGSHGSHVCGIAAESRRKIQNGYIQGIANKSELIFVDLQADDTKGLSSLSSSIPFLEALHFVSDTAGNRPLVVNCSAGHHGGPHDPSPLVVRAIDNLVEMNPGRIVVMSTGNYKMNQTHTEGIVKSGREKQFNWIIHETNMSDKELEIWYPGSDIFSFGIMLPGGKEFLFTQLGEKKSIIANGVEVGKCYHRTDPLNKDRHIDTFIYKGAPIGKWKIILYGNDVVDGRYYAWIERDIDPRYQSKFEKNDSVINSTLGGICTGRQSIVVGAFDPRTSERKLAEFSSLGPTRNGIDKPDICAPGVDIIAPKSTPLHAKPPTSLLVSKSGVSMAAPYVSGAVALLLSASKRMLTISEIRRILLGSADKCSEDNSCCGYGYLNIDTALGKVLDLTRHEYIMKENVISKQKDDQDINHPSKVENFHPLQIKSTAISDSKFMGKMLNNLEHAGESNKLNKFSEDENIYYTNHATAPKVESEIIKIVDDFIGSSQGNIPHSVLLNHVLSTIGAFNIPSIPDILNIPNLSPPEMGGKGSHLQQRDYALRQRGFLSSLKNSVTLEMIYNNFTLPRYQGRSPPYYITHYHGIFEVVARPGTKIFGKLNSGDLSITKMSANYCHLAFIVSPEVMTFGDLVRNNFIAERSNQSEGYVHVVEGKPRHRIIDRFARIICDNYGVVPDNQIVVRIKFRGTSDPTINLSDNLYTYDYDHFADPSLFQEGPSEFPNPQQKFEASLKPTLDLNTVITRARGIISRLNVSGKPNENQKRRIINIYNCLLNKVQNPNVRDFYIAYPDYVHYRHITYGGASQGDLMKEGFIDSSGNWIKFRYVRDFLRKPVYFDYNKTDEDYLKSLALLYNEIDETMTNIRQYLEQREAGGQAGRIQQLALFISREGKNNHSIYSCWGGVSSIEELSEGAPQALVPSLEAQQTFDLWEGVYEGLRYAKLKFKLQAAFSGKIKNKKGMFEIKFDDKTGENRQSVASKLNAEISKNIGMEAEFEPGKEAKLGVKTKMFGSIGLKLSAKFNWSAVIEAKVEVPFSKNIEVEDLLFEGGGKLILTVTIGPNWKQIVTDKVVRNLVSRGWQYAKTFVLEAISGWFITEAGVYTTLAVAGIGIGVAAAALGFVFGSLAFVGSNAIEGRMDTIRKGYAYAYANTLAYYTIEPSKERYKEITTQKLPLIGPKHWIKRRIMDEEETYKWMWNMKPEEILKNLKFLRARAEYHAATDDSDFYITNTIARVYGTAHAMKTWQAFKRRCKDLYGEQEWKELLKELRKANWISYSESMSKKEYPKTLKAEYEKFMLEKLKNNFKDGIPDYPIDLYPLIISKDKGP
jgi:subtilisin family serine protease